MTQMLRSSVLIVEDEVHIREMLADLLEAEGYEVRTCEDGQVAQRLLAERPAALVVSDLVMPEGDGIELQLAMRKHWPDSRFIAISAPNNFSSLNASASLGAHATFEKPLDLPELVRTIRNLISDFEQNQT